MLTKQNDMRDIIISILSRKHEETSRASTGNPNSKLSALIRTMNSHLEGGAPKKVALNLNFNVVYTINYHVCLEGVSVGRTSQPGLAASRRPSRAAGSHAHASLRRAVSQDT